MGRYPRSSCIQQQLLQHRQLCHYKRQQCLYRPENHQQQLIRTCHPALEPVLHLTHCDSLGAETNYIFGQLFVDVLTVTHSQYEHFYSLSVRIHVLVAPIDISPSDRHALLVNLWSAFFQGYWFDVVRIRFDWFRKLEFDRFRK